MIDLNKMNWDYIATVIIPFIVLLLTILFYFLQKRKKKLSYGIMYTKEHSMYEENEIKKPVKEIQIEYVNLGKEPLTKNDFISDIFTKFIEAKILHAEIVNVNSMFKNLYEINYSNDLASLKIMLLNPYESIRVNYTVKDFSNKIHIDAKIIGVRHIGKYKISNYAKQMIYSLSFVYFILLIKDTMETGMLNLNNSLQLFFYISTSFIILMLIQLFRIIKSQYVWYYIWEI